MALNLMPMGMEHYYDLFCDHGLLGLALKERGDKKVYFNDKKLALIDEINRNHHIESEYLLAGPAQDISLLPKSGIFMLGVGGLLMAEILNIWHERGLILENQIFLLGPNYYELTLRSCLDKLGLSLLKRSFIWELGYGYEFFLVQRKVGHKLESPWLDFDESFWLEQVKAGNGAKDHLLKKYFSLQEKRQVTDFEGSFRASMGTFLAKNGLISGKFE